MGKDDQALYPRLAEPESLRLEHVVKQKYVAAHLLDGRPLAALTILVPVTLHEILLDRPSFCRPGFQAAATCRAS